MSHSVSVDKLAPFQRQFVEDLYIHIPFCRQVCSYCDFCVLQCSDILTKRESRQAKFITPYLIALQNEISSIATIWQQSNLVCPLKSIYFGGGTPSTLQTSELASLIRTCRNSFRLSADCEITMELNPNQYKHLDFAYLHKLGLNRVSIGLQTCDTNLLKSLQREHTYFDVKACVKTLKKAGIDNYSLDLIIALPGQSLKDVKRDLDLALALEPKHLSIYSLILEAGSKLYWQYQHHKEGEKHLEQANLALPSEELERKMMHFATNYLEQHGFRHYEISNFAVDKVHESRHNTAVWLARPYFGFGLNASSYLAGVRRTNTRQMKRYIDLWQKPFANIELARLNFFSDELYKAATFSDSNDELTAMEDYFAFALRYLQGVKCQDFCAYFQVDELPAAIKIVLKQAMRDGLIEITGDEEFTRRSVIYITSKGQDYLDEISRNLLGCLH